METPYPTRRPVPCLSRRDAEGWPGRWRHAVRLATVSPSDALGAEAGPPKRGGILRVRGYDPVHFDPHQTTNFKTHTTLSFVYSRLVA